MESTVAVLGGARTVRVTEESGKLRIHIVGGSASERMRDSLTKTVRHMFRLDEDLSAFYELVREDSELSWCATGAGRMLRAPTVFEDVVKTNRTAMRKAVWSRGLARIERNRVASAHGASRPRLALGWVALR